MIIMSAKHRNTHQQVKQTQSNQPKSMGDSGHAEVQPHLDEKGEASRQPDEDMDVPPDRTAGQNRAIDLKRNDEQQYHAGGVAHDPHNRTQERVDRGDPDAGDIDEETRSPSAPFNKTYGHHQ
jgi:hypothetical protein